MNVATLVHLSDGMLSHVSSPIPLRPPEFLMLLMRNISSIDFQLNWGTQSVLARNVTSAFLCETSYLVYCPSSSWQKQLLNLINCGKECLICSMVGRGINKDSSCHWQADLPYSRISKCRPHHDGSIIAFFGEFCYCAVREEFSKSC